MKLLILLPRIPYPLEKGDKLRAFHQLRVLAKNHEITLVAIGNKHKITEKAKAELSPYCKDIRFFNQSVISRYWQTLRFFLVGKPLQSGYFYSCSARSFITQKIKEQAIDHIYCQLFRTAEMVKDTNIPKTIDYQDAFSASMKKRMKAASGIKKLLLSIEYRRVKHYEKKIYSWFNGHTIISESDRELMQMNNLQIVRNGVDTGFFKADNNRQSKVELIFTGNMSYLPNVHTAMYLVNEVMPLIRKERPDARLMLAGAAPDRRVSQLASENVIVTGWMDDIRDAYNEASVFIAPMQIGTGLQNKILEAMAMELPCITSESAWKPINATPKTDILIARTAEEYTQMALELLKNEEKRTAMGKSARAFVVREFNWDACTQKLEAVINHESRTFH